MRVPNYKLDGYFRALKPVENYNGTIRAFKGSSGDYEVWHWNTRIGRVGGDGCVQFVTDYISQTTATLLGRFMRSQDRDEVVSWIDFEFKCGYIDSGRRRQLLRSAGV